MKKSLCDDCVDSCFARGQVIDCPMYRQRQDKDEYKKAKLLSRVIVKGNHEKTKKDNAKKQSR